MGKKYLKPMLIIFIIQVFILITIEAGIAQRMRMSILCGEGGE